MGSIGLMAFSPVQPLDPIVAARTTDSTPPPPFAPDHVDTTSYGWLSFDIDGQLFFVDNEYFGERLSGYTLPGFVLRPRLVLWKGRELLWGKGFTLEGGVHWLHLWGARCYPTLLGTTPWPSNPDSNHRLHLLPWLQAKVIFNERLQLLLGSLGNSGHHLPLPLYNPDLFFVADPEAGIELTYEGSHAVADLWVDWCEYIWSHSNVPERFTAGLSGQLQTYWGDVQLYLPFHAVGRHEGGQNMAVDHTVGNTVNLATGLGAFYNAGNVYYDLRCRLMWYNQRGNPAAPFTSGWGVYPELKLRFPREKSEGDLTVSYWYGKDFVPLLGSWLYSNLSALKSTLMFDRTQLVTAKASYLWTTGHHPCALRLDAAAHYCPDEKRVQYSFGCSILFHPSFRLK